MCGRFTLRLSQAELREMFDQFPELDFPPEMTARFNIAPTQTVLILRAENSIPRWATVRWGLVPRWANSAAVGSQMINARLETLGQKPAFREPLVSQHCLIPADGYYEWPTQDLERQPHYISRCDSAPFAFAGLWESWRSPNHDTLTTCTIITTAATPGWVHLHHRMPVILPRSAYREWLLEPTLITPGAIKLLSIPDVELTHRPVTKNVNKVSCDNETCLSSPDENQYKQKTLF